MNQIPPPILPDEIETLRHDRRVRVGVSLAGAGIAISPTLFFLINARHLDYLLNHHQTANLVFMVTVCVVGSVVCLRPLLARWWTTLLCCPFLAAGFFLTNCAVGLFLGCVGGG